MPDCAKGDDDTTLSVDDLADQSQTTDPEKIYDDLDSLPDWWRSAVDEFADHNLRPYQPPRFADGTVVPPAVSSAEKTYDVEIQFMSIGAESMTERTLYINNEPTVTVEHRRKSAGYTVYGITHEEFEEFVAAALGDD